VKPTFVTPMRRARKPVQLLAVIAVGLASGGVGAMLLSQRDSRGEVAPVPSAHKIELPPSVAQPPPRGFVSDEAPVPAVEPTTARDALTVFLQAQVDGRSRDAFALITGESRRRFSSLATWQTGAVDRLVPRTFRLADERPAPVDHGQAVDIDVDATHEPALDTFGGLVPGRARETWRVWREADRWRVEPDPVNVVAVLPPDDRARAVVGAWVSRLQACDEPAARGLQLGALLYGPVGPGNAPCREPGAWRVGTTTAFAAEADDGTYLAAFGPGIGSWGRLVPVEGRRSRFLVAVGPLGDDWRVLGVLVDGGRG
jgi:hypothetical protein